MCGVTDPSQIEERLVLYERIRRNRASSIQVLSNFGYDETAPPELSEFLEAEGQPMPGKCTANTMFRGPGWRSADDTAIASMGDMVKLAYGHDTVKRTVEVMTGFDPEWRLPDGFFPAGSR